MKVLVHICCAPDSLYFLKRLREDYPEFEIVGFFYDPNIHPYEEYKLRLIETKRTCQALGIELYEGKYDVEGWMLAVKGYEDEPERGKRCKICFDYRLEEAANFAKKIGATHLTTTLLMSPKKDWSALKEAGEKVAGEKGLEFLSLDYRKGNGTQEMFKLSKEFELYHQDYCGCVYGLFKQKKGQAIWDLISFEGRRPGSKEEACFIKAVRLYAEERGIWCTEWEFSFLNWRVLHGKLEVNDKVLPSFVVPFSSSIRGVLKAHVDEVKGDVIFYKKGGLKIILMKEFKDRAVNSVSNITDPTFRVPESFKEELLKSRIKATLQTEFYVDTSRVLLVGSLNAQSLLGVPADTLQDGSGVSYNAVTSFIDKKLQKIVRSEVALVLLGAESLGRVGSNYFKERTGRRLKNLACQVNYD